MRDTSQRSGDAAVTYEVSPHETLSEAVIRAVSTVSGAPPVPDASSDTETDQVLEPLHTVIDPDALDTVFMPAASRTAQHTARVTFSYHGHAVTVTGTGSISVEPHEARASTAAD